MLILSAFNLIPYACLFHRAPGIRNQRRIAGRETSASVQPLKAGAARADGGGWCVLIPGDFCPLF